jgi:photosystem II stability/assembly factor-like uncharacterized protein
MAAADPNWNVIDINVDLTTLIGVAAEDPNHIWLAGDANSVGPEIYRSVDGGHTWNLTTANFGADLLLLGAAAAKDTVIVSSIFGELYSNDGVTFHQSIGGGLSQSVRYIGPNGDGGHSFGVAGTYGGKQGAAITKNGGKTFSHATTDVLFTEARYGAYPTDNTWFVAAGEWPQSQEDKKVPRKSEFQGKDGRMMLQKGDSRRTAPGNDNGYKAQIVKTTDAGNTWTTVFAENGTIYMNGIDCTSETHCCAVGESSDAPAAGAYIYCTFDGQTWNKSFSAVSTSTEHYSLLDVRFLNSTLGWAVGGDLFAIAPRAWFIETKDGGKTWDAQKHELPGYYALGLDVVNENLAYAAIDNLITQSSSVAKWLQV